MKRAVKLGLALVCLQLTIWAGLLSSARAMDYLNVAVQPDQALPAACFSFTTSLPRKDGSVFEPFVGIEPAVDHSLQPRGKDLCLTGLKHGARYTVRLKAGLPAADGTTLVKDTNVSVDVGDRQATLSFNTGRTVLPYSPGVGLPLRSVNVKAAHLVLYRLGERGLPGQLDQDWFGNPLSSDTLAQLAERSSKVFEGRIEIASKPNSQLTTAIPIDQFTKGIVPGIYAAVATIDGRPDAEEAPRATQWFSVSDIGLITVKTGTGLLVSAHSLETAEPMAGVAVQLIAKGGEILGRFMTGADGRIIIPGGLLRGSGGDAARLLSASSARGDYSWIQVDAPGLDLTNLDIEGRTPPGPLDAFLWTDRGIYRPGETIHLGVLLRDAQAKLAPATPILLHLVRPDGIEVDHFKADLSRAGGGTLEIHVPDNAYSGDWTLWAGAGGTDHLGETSVAVEDFVPPRMEARLEIPDGPIEATGSIAATVEADYFYGSPGAGLTGSLEGTIQSAEHPFEAWAAYRFGLEQEPFLPKQVTAQDFTTDDSGRAAVTLQSDTAPDTTGPLEIALRATVNDVDGRAVTAEASHPLHSADRFIGLRNVSGPELTGAGNASAAFDVVLVDGQGTAIGSGSLRWDLVKEDYEYSWFYRDGRWQSDQIVNDTRLSSGEVTTGPDGKGHVVVPVTTGRFRIEVYDAAGTTTASSLRFGAGWWGDAQAETKTPEVMPVTMDANPPAGKVRARIEPAFTGRVLAMLDGNGLHQVQELDMPKGGGTVEFDATDVPASGAYVLAVAVSKTGAVVPRLPARAVGLAWVPGTAAAHHLDVTLGAPDQIQPKTTLAVNVDVAGAPADQPVYVTLAAVDEAVLRMTDFATPDAADHFVGRRAPDLELRDLYGELIDPDGQAGRLVEGGDARAAKQMGGLDVKTFKTVALFSGPLMLDARGHGRIPLDVPEFSGRLRLMAVAWTVDRFGHAEHPVTVRPPLLAEIALPRFLAPGDRATTRVMLTDLEAPEQSYRVALTATGAVALDRNDIQFKDVKRNKRRYVDRSLIATGALGAGHLHMTVTGDDGFTAERDFDIGVRSPNPYLTDRQVRTLDPGQTLAAGDALGLDLVPGTARLDTTVSTLPAFDVPGLFAELRRYEYGCAEQTVSRAFPELYAASLGISGPAPGAGTPTAQGAVARLYSLQAADGSFGYWTAFDTSGTAWLTAYVVDFLQHAEKQGLSVPGPMKDRAVSWLAGRFATAGQDPADVAGAAYAAVVLARSGKLDPSQLRYAATRAQGHLPSALAQVQFAAALTHAGELSLATTLMQQAAAVTRDPKVYLNDYGSDLRDRAMALSLASEEHLMPQSDLVAWAEDLARRVSGRSWFSTQEQAWVLRSAYDLKSKTPLTVTLDHKAVTGRQSASATIPLGQGQETAVTNQGGSPVYVSLATTGVPAGAQPAEAKGFTVARSYFHLDGKPANLADLHQTDELVIEIDGTMQADLQRKVLVVDMLPAGLEPETIGLSGDRDATKFAWLKDLTEPTFTALRDDRYVAGMDLTGQARGFKLAYVVRAVTAGTYAQPGAQVEDMYAPAYHARSAAGTLEVKPARKP